MMPGAEPTPVSGRRHLFATALGASLIGVLFGVATATWFSAGDPMASRPALPSDRGAARRPPIIAPGPRVSMAELHANGGVPLGWQLTPPPGDIAAGMQFFRDAGCEACHAVRPDEEPPAVAAATGPALTGMGSHHPAAYFVESIINPNAVLVEGGDPEHPWISADGHSTMPDYPDLTVAQLTDLVAYLASLKIGERQLPVPPPAPPSVKRPAAPPAVARAFLLQSYEVLPAQLAAFLDWFAHDGRRLLGRVPGLVSLDTFVDVARPPPGISTVFGFRDRAAAEHFLNDFDPASLEASLGFDAFIQPHGHMLLDSAPVYRVPALSVELRPVDATAPAPVEVPQIRPARSVAPGS